MEITMTEPATAGDAKKASPGTELANTNHVEHHADANTYSGEHLAPVNMPGHIQKYEYKPAVVAGGSASGIIKMTMNVDSEELGLHFIKKLFKNELISRAQMQPGKLHRSYLKFGEIHTESDKVALELTTPTGQAGALIDFINLHNPNPYDYPVPNMMAMAVHDGNTPYVTSINADLTAGANLKMDEIDDHTNVVDLQINQENTKTPQKK